MPERRPKCTKPPPRGHLMSHQVRDSDVKVNQVEPAVNKMTVEDGGNNVISGGSYEAKECFSDTDSGEYCG